MSSLPELVVDWCSYQAAKYAVEHWHYSKTMPVSKPSFIGIWEDARYIGTIIYALGASPSLGNPYNLEMWQCCELVRIAIDQHVNLVSKMIKHSIKLIRQNNPNLRLLVSFADPYHGHYGGIYQASGWIYTGRTAKSKMALLDGRLTDLRTYNGHGWNKKKTIPPETKIITVPGKYRYLFPLDRAMRRQIEPLAQPYPKRAFEAKAVNAPGVQPGKSRGRAEPDAPKIT